MITGAVMKKVYIAFLLILLGTGSARADFNDGVVAYLMGDYEKAFNTMISIAKTDEKNGLAQYYLGVMYMKGQGVEQDYKQAGEWLRKAAENRVPQAQYKLANLYTEGKGVPKDLEFAYVWYSVGAAHKHGLSLNALEKSKARLSEKEFSEAEKLVPEYVEKYGPKPEEPEQASPVEPVPEETKS
jgi:TPR repeat protein